MVGSMTAGSSGAAEGEPVPDVGGSPHVLSLAPSSVVVPLRGFGPAGELPVAARPGDAGVDLRAAHDLQLAPRGGRGVVGTGVAVAIPWGFCGLILPRSGLARDHGVTCL